MEYYILVFPLLSPILIYKVIQKIEKEKTRPSLQSSHVIQTLSSLTTSTFFCFLLGMFLIFDQPPNLIIITIYDFEVGLWNDATPLLLYI